MKRFLILLPIIFTPILTYSNAPILTDSIDVEIIKQYQSILQEAQKNFNYDKKISLTFDPYQPHFSKEIPPIASMTNNKNNDSVININRTLLDKETYGVKKFLIFYHVLNIAFTNKDKRIDTINNFIRATIFVGAGYLFSTMIASIITQLNKAFELSSLSVCFYTVASSIYLGLNIHNITLDTYNSLKCEECLNEIITYTHTNKLNIERLTDSFIEKIKTNCKNKKCKFHNQSKNITQ